MNENNTKLYCNYFNFIFNKCSSIPQFNGWKKKTYNLQRVYFGALFEIMEKILESAWALFVAIGWFFINRITAKVDALEKEKADNSAVGKHSNLIHETDRRIDELQYTTVPRQEYKTDIAALHTRANELERSKEDKVTDVRIVNEDTSNPPKKGK